MADDLVLGLASGYDFAQVEPFVVSLRGAGYTGDVCLLYSDLSQETLLALQKYDVCLCPFTLRPLNLFGKRRYGYRLLNRAYSLRVNRVYHLSHLFSVVVRALAFCSGRHNHMVKSRIAARCFDLTLIRFPLYYIFLSTVGRSYKRIMITDVRDVIFQKNPFGFDMPDDPCCFLEDRHWTIGQSYSNVFWLRNGFGAQALAELEGELIVCSGVTMGTRSAILRYLQVMVDQMLQVRHIAIGMDQAVHNIVVRKRISAHIKLYPNEEGPVLTMHYVEPSDLKFNAEGYLIHDDGSVISVLHQYDRHITRGNLSMSLENGRVHLSSNHA